jgi:hypothetical protein
VAIVSNLHRNPGIGGKDISHPFYCDVCDVEIFRRLSGLLISGTPLVSVPFGNWTHVLDFAAPRPPVGGAADTLLAYDAVSGTVALMLPPAVLQTTVVPALDTIEQGWEGVTLFEVAGDRFILFADQTTQRRAIYRVDLAAPPGRLVSSFALVSQSQPAAAANHTHILSTTIDGNPLLFSYDSGSGHVVLESLASDGAGGVTTQVVASSRLGTAAQWTRGWTSLAAMVVGTSADVRTIVIANELNTGRFQTGLLRAPPQPPAAGPPFAVVSTIWDSPVGWAPPGRTHMAVVAGSRRPLLLSYSAATGELHFYRVRGGGSGLDFQQNITLGVASGGVSPRGFARPALGSLTQAVAGAAQPISNFWFYNQSLASLRVGLFS